MSGFGRENNRCYHQMTEVGWMKVFVAVTKVAVMAVMNDGGNGGGGDDDGNYKGDGGNDEETHGVGGNQ